MPENNSELGPRLDLAGNPLPPLPGTQPSAPNTFSGGPYYPPPAAAPSSGSSYQGRPAPQASSNSSAKLWLRVLVGGISFAAAFTAVSAFTPKHTPAPESFTTYTSPDKSFACAAPAGWTTTATTAAKMSDGSASTVGGVLFEQNSAKIDITTDNYATLVAYDVMNNNADPQSLTGSKAGVLHKQWRANGRCPPLRMDGQRKCFRLRRRNARLPSVLRRRRQDRRSGLSVPRLRLAGSETRFSACSHQLYRGGSTNAITEVIEL